MLRFYRRTRTSYTQSEFAVKVGVTNITVHRWETNKEKPQPENVGQICKLLKCKQADLFSDFQVQAVAGVLDASLEKMLEKYIENLMSEDHKTQHLALQQFDRLWAIREKYAPLQHTSDGSGIAFLKKAHNLIHDTASLEDDEDT